MYLLLHEDVHWSCWYGVISSVMTLKFLCYHRADTTHISPCDTEVSKPCDKFSRRVIQCLDLLYSVHPPSGEPWTSINNVVGSNNWSARALKNDGMNISSHGVFYISPSYHAPVALICPWLHIIPSCGYGNMWRIHGSMTWYAGWFHQFIISLLDKNAMWKHIQFCFVDDMGCFVLI